MLCLLMRTPSKGVTMAEISQAFPVPAIPCLPAPSLQYSSTLLVQGTSILMTNIKRYVTEAGTKMQ